MDKKSYVKELLFSIAGQKNKISIHRIFIRLLGSDYTAAAVLDQCVFWTGHATLEDKWFYKSYKEWGEELELPIHKIDRAVSTINVMCSRMLNKVADTVKNDDVDVSKPVISVEKRQAKGAPTLHYQVNMDLLSDWICEFLDYGDSRKSRISVINLRDSHKCIYTESNAESNKDSDEASSSSVTSTCTPKQPPSVKREWQVGDWVWVHSNPDYPAVIEELRTGNANNKVRVRHFGPLPGDNKVMRKSILPKNIGFRTRHANIDDWQPPVKKKTTCRLLSPTVYERRTTIDHIGNVEFENAEDFNPYLEIMANEMWDMGLHGEALIGDRTQTTHRARVALKNLRVWDEQRPIRVAELKAFVPWHKREAKKKGHHHSLGGGEISSSFGTFRKTHDCDGKPISSAPVSDENSGKHPNSVGDFPVFDDDGQYVGWVDDDLMIEYKDGKREKYQVDTGVHNE
jgi:hypothetical protein